MPNKKKQRKRKKNKKKQELIQQQQQQQTNRAHDDENILEDILDKKENPSAFSCAKCHRRFPDAQIQYQHMITNKNCHIQKNDDNISKREKRNIFYDLHQQAKNIELKFDCVYCHKLYNRELNAIRCMEFCSRRNINMYRPSSQVIKNLNNNRNNKRRLSL